MTDLTKVAAAIVVAALIIGLAIFLRPMPDRYTFKVGGGAIQRFDTVSGEAMLCERDGCTRMDKDGHISVPLAAPEVTRNSTAHWRDGGEVPPEPIPEGYKLVEPENAQ